MKLSENLPKDDTYYGVWLTDDKNPDSDVTVNVSKTFGVVIAQDVSIKDKIEFSDTAVWFKDNKVMVQFVGEDDEPVHVEVSKNDATESLLTFLEDMKELAQER